MSHFISSSCEGERCSMCDKPATHKVGEEIMWDDPNKMRHNLTAYVCCDHFRAILGPAGACPESDRSSEVAPSGWWTDELEKIFIARIGDPITADMKRAANIALKVARGERWDEAAQEWEAATSDHPSDAMPISPIPVADRLPAWLADIGVTLTDAQSAAIAKWKVWQI